MSSTGNQPKHLLVIDDDEMIVEAIQMLFETRGFRVSGKPSPVHIVQDLKNLQPDCLLMDISMPPFNGCDICRSLRAQGYQIPIILFCAKNISNQEAIACGANEYIAKPFKVEDLVTRIRVVLDA